MHRVARIIPAFLVCLVVTAAVFGPIALWATRGSLDGYLTAKPSPLQYVWSNLFLHIDGYQIGETLTTVPYPNTWNGSLWTLWFEFLCYLLIWVLGGLAIFRRSIIFVAGLWIVAVVIRGFGVHGINAGLDTDFDLLMRLLPYFLGGSLVYFVIDRCGLVRLLGLLAIPAAAVLMVFVQDLGGPLAAPLIGYALLTLSTFIPQPGWVARNDVSYGFYIYAWPVQQLSVIFGAAKVGLLGYTAVTTVGTLVFAVASWFLVERPVMRLARGSKTSATAEPDPGASQQPQAQQQQP